MAISYKALKLVDKILFLMIFIVSVMTVSAQDVNRVEPPFWWAGMYNPKLQLLVHGKNLGKLKASSRDSTFLITNTHYGDSPHYIFIDLDISKATPGEYTITLDDGSKTIHVIRYQLKKRKDNSAHRQGLSSADVVYLITPDRFSNGDKNNDEVAGLKEGLNRAKEYGRHGGDLRGIENHIPYISNLGFTAIWLNPVLENDQPQWSYHGYSTTDYYNVDPRFGSNETYVRLAEKAADSGLGLVMDIIVNHCGSHHWWMEDLPFDDWINVPNTDDYVQTNHRKETLRDPYASALDRKNMVEGWFVPTMPDLNQRNKFMSTYLIQNSIWWIEYAHLNAIRQDTYSYPFKEFMTDWTCAIKNEYPNFFIVGEEWVEEPAMIAYWQAGQDNTDSNNSCLPSLMDFPLCFALNKALSEEESWNTGLIRIYQSLATDYHYSDPSQLVIFADNHDMKRTFVQLGEDIVRFKMAIALLLTTRGIPQLYYGTEILMNTGKDGSHGRIRSDFPGGWAGDTISVVENRGIGTQQKEAQDFCRRLLRWRQDQTVIHHGRLMHFVPEDGVYVYFRYNEAESVMVVINKNEETNVMSLNRFEERLNGFGSYYDVLREQQGELKESMDLAPNTVYVLELRP